jgi:hypothetical protein
MLRLQNHKNYHLKFEYASRMLYAYSNQLHAHSKYSRSNISMNPLSLLSNSRRGESYQLISSLAHFCCCFSDTLEALSVVYFHSKCVVSSWSTFKIWQELLSFIT